MLLLSAFMFPSVPTLTPEQPQPSDSAIAPAGHCHLSQEEGFLSEVTDDSRPSLQGLLVRASGLPSSLCAYGPARPLLWSSPCTASDLLLSALLQDPGLHLSPRLAFRSLHLAPDCLMDLPMGLPSPWTSRVNSSHSCSDHKVLCSSIFLFCGASAPDTPKSIFWVFYVKES